MVERKPSAPGQGSASTPSRRAASPYGTRSRNRGAGRINYAEDKDDAMDFEMTSTASAAAVPPTTQPATTTTTTNISTTTTTTTSTNGTTNGTNSSAGATKKSITAAVPPTKETTTPSTVNHSKKRKAVHPQPPKQDQLGMLSNMPYFDKPYLNKDGSITSTDGLKLSPNGTCIVPVPAVISHLLSLLGTRRVLLWADLF